MLTNSATVSSDTAGSTTGYDDARENTTVKLPLILAADLSIAMADSLDPAHSGTKLTYTLFVTNT